MLFAVKKTSCHCRSLCRKVINSKRIKGNSGNQSLFSCVCEYVGLYLNKRFITVFKLVFNSTYLSDDV